jgi:hypothetical protein
MHNDSKLGLLAGVAGVIVAAVMFSRTAPATPGTSVQAQPAAPLPAATPTHAGPVAKSVASTPIGRGRTEIEGKTTSQSHGEDDE